MIDFEKDINFYLKKLFPITRSITGKGNKETLEVLKEIIPLEINSYPSGQRVYDWTIPKEWNIKDAWIKNSKGKKIVDYKNSNLHVLSYSIPVSKKINLKDLQEKLHFIKNMPNAIPYRTSYYEENWGFCLSYDHFKENFHENEEYEVCIESELKKGKLHFGELLINGKNKKEYLISCYICHPSMANDSLSGVILTAFLSKYLLDNKEELEHSYRIIFVPETIGSISYLANNESAMKKIDSGLVITTVGGPGKIGFKQSFNEAHEINQIIEDVLIKNHVDYIKHPFDIRGSDERQYSSPGFRINVATITKDKYYDYDYYHTSLDDLKFVKANYINETLKYYIEVLDLMDKNITLKSNYQNGEVMLGKHNLYPEVGGSFKFKNDRAYSYVDLILWLLFYSDGDRTLLSISRDLDQDLIELYKIAKVLEEKNIVEIL